MKLLAGYWIVPRGHQLVGRRLAGPVDVWLVVLGWLRRLVLLLLLLILLLLFVWMENLTLHVDELFDERNAAE